ncbi:hypothetical protein OHA98_01950 [Streptomyces sp. NBC_00654]|uniref:hypothetical protein n=1 Tax=Streptomyces sp. NBC_00654 TaxID=2975799 RepID=UPI002251DC02|nr:hypothetical protein [Streptomyces sp. NBC_00654]MCX4963598.1 hypothetical protein [Streptomyces sp. NBC_00654]
MSSPDRIKQESAVSQVLDEIGTPDYFGRALLSAILRDATEKLRSGDGDSDHVELSAKIVVSFSAPTARSDGFCFHTDHVWVCVFPE